MDYQFSKLDELIKDDDKIVTVPSFASLTNISCEEAQEVLKKYVEINKESKKIRMTYIIDGVKKDSKKCSVVQVNDETLQDEKRLYCDDPPVIIFSIQKAKLIDYNIISLLESGPDINADVLPGAIIGKNCVKRHLRKKSLPPLPAATVKGKCSIFMKQSSGVKSEVKATEQIEERNECNEEKITKPKGNGQGSITSMFNKATHDKKNTVTKREKSAQLKPKQNGSLSNFLSSQASKGESREMEINEIKEEKIDTPRKENAELNSNRKPENTKDLKEESEESDFIVANSEDELLKDLAIPEQKRKTNSRTNEKSANAIKSKTSQKKKRAKADVGNDHSVKKRKRIIVDEGSDSDDIFGSEKSDDEDIREKSDEEPETIKASSKVLPPKNKRKKAVKRTYEDDEGFIVTQTEFVYETASEDENEPDNKMIKTSEVKPTTEKKDVKKSKNEISPNKSTKSKKDSKKTTSGTQPTLMNFFKRK